MRKKHIILMITTIFLSILHLVLSLFYVRLYAYFNEQGSLQPFVLSVQIFRLACYVLIGVSGFLAVQDKQKKVLLFDLCFFLFNLILPYLFTV